MDPATTKTGLDVLAAAWIAGGVFGGMFVFRFLEPFLGKKLPQFNNRGAGLTSTQATELHDLATVHAPRDEDNVPLWYVPRAWGEHLEAILVELRKMNGKLANVPTLIGSLEEHRREELAAHTSIQQSQGDMKSGINSVKDSVGKIKLDVREARADLRDLKKDRKGG